MQVNHVEAVSKMQHYIHEHIEMKITLNDLATVANYSPFHAAKIFKEVTGINPFDYIRRLRLTHAAKILRDQNVHILDVALDFVFDSHEGFTRAFTKRFGISPKRYQQNPKPVKWFTPYLASLSQTKSERKDDLMNEEKVFTIFTQVIERPERKAIILRGKKARDYFAYCDEVGCDIYGLLLSVKEALYEPVGMWLPKKLIKPHTSEYVHGVEVPIDYNEEIPEGCALITLEAQSYLVFQSEPYDDENFEDYISIQIIPKAENIRHYVIRSKNNETWDIDIIPASVTYYT
ncbi:MAG: helix-turn-helix transcriptional regulator, partial [Candidatus Izemoplasmataceae bacterium]